LCTCAYLTFSWTKQLDAVTVKLHGKGKGPIFFIINFRQFTAMSFRARKLSVT